MNISKEGIDFIKSYEGCRLRPYLDQGGVPTIGWGFTYYPNGIKVTMNDLPMSQMIADQDFLLIVKPYADNVVEACIGSHIPLNQSQLDALTSFSYNCGVGAFKQSTLLQHVLKGNVVEADFTLYDHVKGQVSVGLLNRRKAEYQLFIKSIKTMENTEVNDGQAITAETPQVCTINSVTVSITNTVNGVESLSESFTIPVLPEIIAYVQANKIASGYNITVKAA